jgi:hypothetical protein
MSEATFGVAPEYHIPHVLWLQMCVSSPHSKPGRKMAGPGWMIGRR